MPSTQDLAFFMIKTNCFTPCTCARGNCGVDYVHVCLLGFKCTASALENADS